MALTVESAPLPVERVEGEAKLDDLRAAIARKADADLARFDRMRRREFAAPAPMRADASSQCHCGRAFSARTSREAIRLRRVHEKRHRR